VTNWHRGHRAADRLTVGTGQGFADRASLLLGLLELLGRDTASSESGGERLLLGGGEVSEHRSSLSRWRVADW
jgi:hypothetical protein